MSTRVNLPIKVAVPLLAAGAIVLYACKAPTINRPAAIPPPAPVAITTSYQGAQVVSEMNQAKEMAYNTAIILKDLAAFGFDVILNDPALAITTPVACSDYGSYSYTGSVDASGVYDLTLSFSLCRTDGLQFDGTYTLQGGSGSVSIALTKMRVVRFNDSYSAIIGTLQLDGLSYSVSGQKTATDESFNIGVNGEYVAFDYVMLGQFTIRMSGLTLAYSSSIDPVTSNKTGGLIANGTIRESWPDGSLFMTYSDLSIFKVENYSAGPPAGYASSDTTVSGTAIILVSPVSLGPSGVVSVATPTTPIHHDYATGEATQGGMTVSGAGSADATFNASGSIDVVVGANAPVSFNREYFLNNMVNFFGMETTLPQLMGATGVAPTPTAAGSKWPATMTVTALSSGSDLNCYTDVHVSYYNPTDMLVPQKTWYVDWAINLVNSCTPPVGIPFEEARDITGDTTCDAGLDINGADQDITSGGVEHFTSTNMPEGYYTVSIDNYTCAAGDVSNMGSIIIGDYMFGTYDCPYTASDMDGSTPGAWCRLADIQVDPDGTVKVLSPNPTFTPWHN